MLPRIGLCLLTILMLRVDAAAQDNLRDALLAQERNLIDAINKKDKAAIAVLLADEAMSITSRGRQTTAEIIADLENLSFTDYTISEVKTIAVSRDAAILTYRFSWTGSVAGQPAATTTVYAASVWKQRDGKWRSVFYQETPLTK